MTHVRLPRPLSSYFAFGEDETDGTRRRFGLYFPFRRNDDQVEGMRWVWSIDAAELERIGPEGVAQRRQVETERFVAMIEWWLRHSDNVLVGDDAIPLMVRRSRLKTLAAAPQMPPEAPPAAPAELPPDAPAAVPDPPTALPACRAM